MLWPAQNLQALMHLYGDLSANFVVSNPDEEPYENGSRQCHGESGIGMSAVMKIINLYCGNHFNCTKQGKRRSINVRKTVDKGSLTIVTHLE